MTTTEHYLASAHSPGLEGHYAGAVTRFAAFVIDIVVIATLFSLFGHVVEFVVSVLSDDRIEVARGTLGSRIALGVWAFVYFAHPLAVSGRTFGMAVAGIRVVRTDGSDINGWHAVLRVLALPLSFLLFGLGLLLILLRRDRRALHDLIASTAVVYAWDARAARLRFLLKR
jgi:uncharacterized RDD family membrane protein YckC